MIGLLLALWLQSGDAQAAAAAYQDGRVEEARLHYLRLLDLPAADAGALHHNLGHCALELGRPAEAIYHYLQAGAHGSFAADLPTARAEAERRLGLLPPPAPAPHQQLLAQFDAWSPGQALAVLALSLTIGGIGLLLLRGRGWLWLPALLLLLSLAGAGRLAHRAWLAAPEGIVLDEAAPLREEPHAGLPARLSLPPGARVRILARSDRWLQVEHLRGTGWTAASAIGLLDGPTR